MDKGKTKQERLNKIREVAEELGLNNCMDTVIGVPGSVTGLSGGEKKRLAFASEILTNPMLMFCDEPTSGLDSSMSENVVSMLKDLSRVGRTILFTIHQPSADIFSSFDHLLLLAEGRVAFQGPGNSALSFFEKAGYMCPTNYNPPDFFIKCLSVVPGKEKECRNRIQVLHDFHEKEVRETIYCEENEKLETHFMDKGLNAASMYKTTLINQFKAVLWRCWVLQVRDKVYTRMIITQSIAISLLFGVLYFNQEQSEEGYSNITSVLYLITGKVCKENVVAGLTTFIIDRPMFVREHWNGMYRTEVYFLCKTVTQFPMMVFRTTLFITICYWMIGLRTEFSEFLYTLLLLVLTGTAARCFGFVISACVPTVKMGVVASMPFLLLSLFFGGFFLNTKDAPMYIQWMKFLSWVYYGYESIMITQFQDVTNITCTDTVCTSTGHMILSKMNFHEGNFNRNISALFGMSSIGYLVALVILLLKNRRRT